MRSVAAGSFERLSDTVALWRAFRACRRGKSRQPRMAEFDLDAHTHVLALHHALREGSYAPLPWRSRIVRDPKTRLIAAPAIRDRIVHRAVLDQIGPTYERSFVPHHYACGHGRGPHRAVLRFLAAMRRYRCRLTLDIRRYFPSIHRPVLLRLFEQRLRASDDDTLRLLGQLLDADATIYETAAAKRALGIEPADGTGIGLGSYLSQWCGAFYLDGLDHFVLREVGVGDYVRYQDDFALFGDDAGLLQEALARIRDWLREHRRLELKPTGQQVVSNRQACVFLGYRVSRSGVSASRKLRRRLRDRVRAAAVRGPDALSRTLESYRGLLLF